MNGDNGASTLLPLFWMGLWLAFVLTPAFVAKLVAPPDRPWTFFWITLFFLGPLGPGVALIAQRRPYQPPPPPMRWPGWPEYPKAQWPKLPD